LESSVEPLDDSVAAAAQNAPGSLGAIGLPATGPDRDTVPSLHGDPLSVVEKHLATFIGPLAILIVSRARKKSAEPEEQFAMLAASVSDKADQQAFLSRKDEILRCLAEIPSIKSPSAAAANPAQRHAELTPEAIQHASELLTRYVGPISRVLTDRAAKRAENLQALYLMLAEHLTDSKERARFLSDGGFSEE
jgi:serine/threonine-protein kinase